jgi:hypothetical protein
MNQRGRRSVAGRHPPRGTPKDLAWFSHGSTAFPIPRGTLRCKQVSRLGFILLAHLPTGRGAKRKSALLRPRPQWHPRAFVRFTVTGIARKSHPRSHDGRGGNTGSSFSLFSRAAAHCCADTPAIHLSLWIIRAFGLCVKSARITPRSLPAAKSVLSFDGFPDSMGQHIQKRANKKRGP